MDRGIKPLAALFVLGLTLARPSLALAQTAGPDAGAPIARPSPAADLTPRAYLPMAFSALENPPAPILDAINNPSGGGSYTVSWGAVEGAVTYALQEDATSSFAAPQTYTTTATSRSVSGNPAGAYYYRVRASNGAGDSDWSNVQSTTVAASAGPRPGFWESATGDEFYVTPDRTAVARFAIYITVNGCGSYKITHIPLAPITSDSFSFSGSFYASGTFDSETSAFGIDGLTNFVIAGCGTVNGGPWFWVANWQNDSQPSAAVVPAVIMGPDGVAATTTLTVRRAARDAK
jgi:hypothetical protein